MVRSPGRLIALVAPQYPPAAGGVERHVSELARGLVALGHRVEVAACDPTRPEPWVDEDRGVVVRRFPTIGGDATFFVSPGLVRWLFDNAARFDMVHAHSYHTPLALAALIAARRARRPFALTPHYHGVGHSPLRAVLHVPYRLPGTLLVRHARPLICVSHADQALLQRHFGDDLATWVAPNGVDVDAIVGAPPAPDPRGQALVLVAGRLEAYKQVDHVIEALPFLPDQYSLVITGDGPARPALEQRAAELGVERRVELRGHVDGDELRGLMRRADAFVSLSRHEAFGMAPLEAAVAGAGVVASAIDAHRELTGYLPIGAIELIEPDAAPADVAAAIARAHREERSGADLARVPRWTDTVVATLAAYEAAAGWRAAAGGPGAP